MKVIDLANDSVNKLIKDICKMKMPFKKSYAISQWAVLYDNELFLIGKKYNELATEKEKQEFLQTDIEFKLLDADLLDGLDLEPNETRLLTPLLTSPE